MLRAVIVGHTGQDGRILWDQLATRGFALIGISRGGLRLHQAHWDDPVDIGDAATVRRLVDAFRPDQIYFLAAHHHSSQDVKAGEPTVLNASWAVHVQAFFNFLDAVRQCSPTTRIFYASSSRVFGQTSTPCLTEATPLRPACMYGITKAAGMMLADYHRRTHGAYVSCGILFNHESPLRNDQFVSQRIVNGLAAVKAGIAPTLQIGDLEARADWGYAPDYTRAMQLMLETDMPGDFVVASGQTHTVRELVEIAAEVLEVDWHGRVVESERILQRPPQALCGDASRLRAATGWRPTVSFREMIRIMAQAALERLDNSPP